MVPRFNQHSERGVTQSVQSHRRLDFIGTDYPVQSIRMIIAVPIPSNQPLIDLRDVTSRGTSIHPN